jgi:hypothetical protein
MADAEVSVAQTTSPASPSPEELLLGEGKKKRLGSWYASAICGNDITSSCLYVSAIAIVYAGALAPLARELDVPKNMMFMGSLTEKQIFSVQDLGGVRVIF